MGGISAPPPGWRVGAWSAIIGRYPGRKNGSEAVAGESSDWWKAAHGAHGLGGDSDGAEMAEFYDLLPDVVTLFEPVRDASGAVIDARLVYLNGVARAAIPDPEAAIGRLCTEIWPGTATNGMLDALVSVATSGTPAAREMLWTDAKTFKPGGYEVRVAPVSPDRLVSVGRDITDRLRHEWDLRHRIEHAAADAGGRTDDIWDALIRTAIDEDRFTVYAQPVVDLSTGDVAAYELLLRLQGIDGEVFPPAAFVSAAEERGLMSSIDRSMVRRAAAIAAGGDTVSVNLSAQSVEDPGMLGDIGAALSEANASPDHVIFEITETALMTDVDFGETFVGGLRGLGCQVALDDFGSGFGTITYLRQFRTQYIKIDADYVRSVAQNERDQKLVGAIVSVARAFGQKTIAEGVEDETTLEFLRSAGVDYAQGHLLGRPGPAAEVIGS